VKAEQIIASVGEAINDGKHFDHRLQIVTAERKII
jgi:hypothetical protein